MQYKGFQLDPFQEHAIELVDKNYSVVVSAPTGSGKTLIADYVIEQKLHTDTRVIYTAPIKALSNQKYHDFSAAYGKDKVGLMTGDEVINPSAQVVVMTTEIYRNMVLVQDPSVAEVSYVVFDEIHYINDIERGVVWEESVIFSPDHVRFLCLSATIPNHKEFAGWIQHIKKHKARTVVHTTRSVPLKKRFYEESAGLTTLDHLKALRKATPYRKVFRKKGKRQPPRFPKPSHTHLLELLGPSKTPLLFFCFSRATTQKYAIELAGKTNKLNKDIITFINNKLAQVPPQVALLKTTIQLKESLPKGIGFHHAGLIPVLKEIVEELFTKGLIDTLYVTETFAVGINMPAKTVCFDDLRKFNGVTFGYMTSKEFFQMAGRAGRRGMDKVGYVVPMINFRNFDYEKIQSITSKDTEPLRSQFRLAVNTVLNLIKSHQEDEINRILKQSFYAYQRRNPASIQRTYKNMVRKLKKLSFLTPEGRLTPKGEFASRIFCDETVFAEIFATSAWKKLSTYEIALVIAAMVYEERRGDAFYANRTTSIERSLYKNMHTIMGKQAPYINDMSSLVYPIFSGKTFFDMLKNTNKDEGDLMRLLSQVLDRLQQLMRAADDYDLRTRLKDCFSLVKDFVSAIA